MARFRGNFENFWIGGMQRWQKWLVFNFWTTLVKDYYSSIFVLVKENLYMYSDVRVLVYNIILVRGCQEIWTNFLGHSLKYFPNFKPKDKNIKLLTFWEVFFPFPTEHKLIEVIVHLFTSCIDTKLLKRIATIDIFKAKNVKNSYGSDSSINLKSVKNSWF